MTTNKSEIIGTITLTITTDEIHVGISNVYSAGYAGSQDDFAIGKCVERRIAELRADHEIRKRDFEDSEIE